MERYDWQQRTELLLGEEKMERIRNAHVLVVGLGGVGAYAAEMICRAGVGRMTIVDADTVQPTNMNRQLPVPCIPRWGGRKRKCWQPVIKI
ncbi:ThiF family adenylyltransferase [Bacteroides ovatus]|nr:ThiF family adenylyltransferase [Bacteroides ovatus]